jgi:methionine aminopeptidase
MKILKCPTTENVVVESFIEGMVVAIEPMINMGTKTSNN